MEQISALWTDPAVTEHIGGPRDRNLVTDFFRQYAADPDGCSEVEGERWWSAIERTSGELVGLCSLIEKEVEGRPEIDFGYFLLPSYWGRGYATEAAGLVIEHAFSDLRLESLVAVIHPDNTRSASVARKLGMRLEREVLRSDGVVRHLYRLYA